MTGVQTCALPISAYTYHVRHPPHVQYVPNPQLIATIANLVPTLATDVTHEPIPHWVFASKNAVTLCKSIECVLLGLAQNKYNPYFLSSHLLHSSRSLTDGRTPNSIFAISRYKNPSSGTLHFLHFLVITDSLYFCVLH